MKKQNLVNFLENLDPNTMVYVGCKNGNGWLYIETAENVLNNLDKVDSKICQDAKRKVANAQEKLEVIPAFIVDTQNLIKKCDDKEKLKLLKAKIAKYETEFVSAFETRKLWRPYVNCWTKLGYREVVDTYNHTSDIAGIAILIEGMDLGSLWFYNEKKVI